MNKPKSQVAKVNGKNPQHIEKVTLPQTMNRRQVDLNTIQSRGVASLWVAGIFLVIGCVGGYLVFLILVK